MKRGVIRFLNKLTREDWVLVLFACAILTLPWLLTRTWVSVIDFSSTGQIGDTIGGITAPFVGLLSALLIYRAFVVQVKANTIQNRNSEFAIALKLIDDLEARLIDDNNPFEYTDGEITTPSDKAQFSEIVRLFNGIRKYRVYYKQKIVLMIKQINYFMKYVKSSKSLSDRDKNLLIEKASLTFGARMYSDFEIMLGYESSVTKEDEKQFYAYCRKFFTTTLNEFLFFSINIDDFN
jgi:hypothetical protein